MPGVPIDVDLQAHGVGGNYEDYRKSRVDSLEEHQALVMLVESARILVTTYDEHYHPGRQSP